MRSIRSRALGGRVHNQGQQSHSLNDILAIPATDASKFLDMLGRASARVDENSRKRMKAAARARESESGLRAFDQRGWAAQRSELLKGKGRMRASTAVVVTRSMDELGDHTNLRRDGRATDVHHSSLPIMQSKDPLSQPRDTMHSATMRPADNKSDDDGDVHMHMHMHTSDSATDAPPPRDDDEDMLNDVGVIIEAKEPPVPNSISTGPQNGASHFPPRPTATLMRHSSQKKRLEPPSPTPVRAAPTPPPTALRVPFHVPVGTGAPLPPQPSASAASGWSSGGGGPTASPTASKPLLSQRCASTTTTTISTPVLPASQTHGGSRRALGMTRNAPPSNTPQPRYSASVKKPFRPPLAKPAAKATATTVPVPMPCLPSSIAAAPTSTSTYISTPPSRPARNRQAAARDATEGAGADPDSSFDISFDFDPEALEAAMKEYD
jgi:hypothetical protein